MQKQPEGFQQQSQVLYKNAQLLKREKGPSNVILQESSILPYKLLTIS